MFALLVLFAGFSMAASPYGPPSAAEIKNDEENYDYRSVANLYHLLSM